MNFIEDRRKRKEKFCKSVSKFLNSKKDGNSLSGNLYITEKSLEKLASDLSGIGLRDLKLNLKASFTHKQVRRLVDLLGL